MSSSRVKLRPSVHYAPIEGGVLFKGWAGSFVVKGPPSLWRLIEAIVPLLDQGVDRQALRASAKGAGDVVDYLLAEMTTRNMLLDLDSLNPDLVPTGLAATFAATVAHLEALADDPYGGFLAFRNASVFAAGNGDALAGAIRSLAGLGCSSVTCWSSARNSNELNVLASDWPETRLHLINDDLAWRLASGDWTLALVIADSFDEEILRLVRAAAAGRPVVEGFVSSQLAVVLRPAPVGRPNLDDAMARLRVHQRAAKLSQEKDDDLSPVLAILAGNIAAYLAFRQLAGVTRPAETGDAMVIRQQSLRSTWHFVEPIPDAAADPGSTIGRLRGNSAANGPEAFLAAAEHLADEFFGIAGSPEVRGLPQNPVFVARSAVFDQKEPVIGFGASASEARARALAQALALTSAGELGSTPVDVHDFDGKAFGCVPSSRLILSAGFDLNMWVRDGVARLFAVHGDLAQSAGCVDLRMLAEELSAPAVAVWWHVITKRLGREVDVWCREFPSVLGIHSAWVCDGGERLAMAVGPTRRTAAAGALMVASGRAQLRAAGMMVPSLNNDCEGLLGWLNPIAGGREPELERPDLQPLIAGLKLRGLSLVCKAAQAEPAVHKSGLVTGWLGLVLR